MHYRVSHKVFVNVGWRSLISFWKRRTAYRGRADMSKVRLLFIRSTYMSDASLDICSKQTEDK